MKIAVMVDYVYIIESCILKKQNKMKFQVGYKTECNYISYNTVVLYFEWLEFIAQKYHPKTSLIFTL